MKDNTSTLPNEQINQPLWPYGQSEVLTNNTHSLLCSEVQTALHQLQEKAGHAGFSLRVASGFRGFERQLTIWNRKATGQQGSLDEKGLPINMTLLSDTDKVFAILRWSALPGASRHHWGTDIDVFDASAVADDYVLQLSQEEVDGDGVFAPMHRWLDEQITNNAAFGFFRPYPYTAGNTNNENGKKKGIAPERWHLSYAPLARKYQKQFSMNTLRQVIEAANIELKQSILDNLDSIYQHYIHVPFSLYPEEELEW